MCEGFLLSKAAQTYHIGKILAKVSLVSLQVTLHYSLQSKPIVDAGIKNRTEPNKFQSSLRRPSDSNLGAP